MTEERKTRIEKAVKIMEQLDEQRLLLVKNAADVLLVQQKMNKNLQTEEKGTNRVA